MTGPAGGLGDSAGVPWAGRTLTPQPFAGDDGRADPRLAAALADGDEEALAAALAGARVLVPVVAVLGDHVAPVGAGGLPGDKSVDMAVATLVRPDGRKALPVFSSVQSLSTWDGGARPLPAEGSRAALSAVGDGCDTLVVDPAGPWPRVVRRPVVWALAQGRRWSPPARDLDVLSAVEAAAEAVPGVERVRCEAGEGVDLAVVVGVERGLDADALTALAGAVRDGLAGSAVLAERVEGLQIRVVPAHPWETRGNS